MDFKVTSGGEKGIDVTAERKEAKDSEQLQKLSINQELNYCEHIMILVIFHEIVSP